MPLSEALVPTTPTERQLIRYRSDYVVRALYMVFAGQKSWQTMATHDRYDGRTIETPSGSVSKGGKYLHIPVDGESSLGIERHELLYWQSDLKTAFKQFRFDETDAWTAMMFRDYWQAIWYVRRSKRVLQRAPTTSEALAAACYKVAKLAREA